MTREETIKALGLAEHIESIVAIYDPGEVGDNITVRELKEACRTAVAALRAQQEPNAALTLDELREMDGDKIYVHYINGLYTDEDGAYFGKFWKLVREFNGKLTACELPLEYYGKTWLAYRRKPEEGMT